MFDEVRTNDKWSLYSTVTQQLKKSLIWWIVRSSAHKPILWIWFWHVDGGEDSKRLYFSYTWADMFCIFEIMAAELVGGNQQGNKLWWHEIKICMYIYDIFCIYLCTLCPGLTLGLGWLCDTISLYIYTHLLLQVAVLHKTNGGMYTQVVSVIFLSPHFALFFTLLGLIWSFLSMSVPQQMQDAHTGLRVVWNISV